MKIDFLTLFPDLIENYFRESIMKRAREAGFVEVDVHNIRNWAQDKYGTVDGRPYGGGPGMVLRVDVVGPAIEELKSESPDSAVILTTPQGERYSQAKAVELSGSKSLIIIAGHYEGFDDRIRELVDMELSIGDYVVTGGELPALVIADSIIRLLPGVLGDDKSSVVESFSSRLLEYPQYTRPEEYGGKKVPEVLLSGDHKKIEEWRNEEAVKRTRERRPDLTD